MNFEVFGYDANRVCVGHSYHDDLDKAILEAQFYCDGEVVDTTDTLVWASYGRVDCYGNVTPHEVE
jgi:hypothetical protein